MTAAPVARLEGVWKAYGTGEDEVPVLRGADLCIGAAEKVSLVGPSGSGKSTLLLLLAGLLTPDRGMVEIAGRSIHDLRDRERAALRASTIGVALQSDNLIPFLTAAENVTTAMVFDGQRGRADRAAELLDRFGVGHRRNHLPRQLSGGEAQRVALAVSLANDPALLLADEMVSSLDEDTAGDVIDQLFSDGLAVLFVTHDPALARLGDRCLRLRSGQVVTS
jgi:putative ABC transport system ATP-binding protein